ncbi:MAG TPA: cytochrome c [Gemmatimonadaceae bacterium]|nr:cytochrome c [Gemmatimonadaceae bacterium]
MPRIFRTTAASLQLLFMAAGLVLPLALRAQNGGDMPRRSTLDGVFTREQAARGRDVYDGMCLSCHPAVTHTGPQFVETWSGKRLGDLFSFVVERMPKNDPGSLSLREYADVLAYILRLNGMPPGPNDLPVDSLALNAIRLEFRRGGSP